jgi:sigma-B regulation protein RsbU (phosphoserine phosphatase)
MWDTVAIVVLSLVAVALAGAWWQQRRRTHSARLASAVHDAEERRLFEFLHELGEMLYQDVTPRQLHRRVVRGVASVVKAGGGALYFFDAGREQLVPGIVSHDCPPLIELPESLVGAIHADRPAVRSHVLLQCIPSDSGALGDSFSRGSPLHLANLRDHPSFAALPAVPGGKVAAMMSPLVYGGKKLGVLAVARSGRQPAFSAREFELFKSMAEQSAFALGSAMVREEVLEKRRIEDELRRASEIQRVLLPSEPPAVEGFSLAATYQPAKVVSGDYYDFFRPDDRHLGIVIADVAGKGISAGLVMATCRGLLRVCAQSELSPAAVLSHVNRMIFADIREDMFVSLAYCVIDTGTGEVSMARAGHDPPFLFRHAGRAIEALRAPGLALGVDKGPVFERTTRDFTFQMEPGDCLLLYTDGVTEALDPSGIEEFGTERLRVAFQAGAASERSATGILNSVQASLADFVKTAVPSDDLTLVAIERSVNSSRPLVEEVPHRAE